MSASDKKRARKAQESAALTERQKAAQKEAKQLKAYTWSFWVIIALCVCIVIGVAVSGPVNAIINQNTHAVTVGGHHLKAVDLNYFYIDVINNYYNENSSWISYLLNVNQPLGDQVYDKNTGATWADNFLDMAIEEIKNTYALRDAAVTAGHKLTEDEQKSLDTLKSNLKVYAEYYGYSNTNKYLTSIYGRGANEKSYMAYYEATLMANSYYNKYSEDLKDSYTPTMLRDFEGDKPYEYNSYNYLSYFMSVDKFKTGGTKGEDGKITYTEEELQAARDALKKAAEELAIADNNTAEKLNEAIKNLEIALEAANNQDNTTESTPDAQTEGETTDNTTNTETGDNAGTETDDNAGTETDDKKEDEKKYPTCTENNKVLFTNITSVMQEWMRSADRKEGDITAIAQTSTSTDADGKEVETITGYYVVVFRSVSDNNFALANVRHVLISFEGGTTDSTTGQKKYTDEEKKAAKEKAEKLYNEWKEAGVLTEDSFAELAKKNSKDSAEDGGLFEDVYPGQMVTNFNDWCFAEERKAGDHGLIESDYGYHIMFYCGDSETSYRDYMVSANKLKKDMEEWENGLVDAIKLELINSKRINRDLILNSGY